MQIPVGVRRGPSGSRPTRQDRLARFRANDPDGLSPEARRNADNNALIEKGVHPATRRALLGDGSRCRTCAHARGQGGVAGSYLKCLLHTRGVTGGPATDIRGKWPACLLYEPRDPR